MYVVHNSKVTSKQVNVPIFVPRNNPTANNGVNSRRESISTEKTNLSMVRKLTDIRNPTGSKYQTAKLTIRAESEPLRSKTNCVDNSVAPNFHFSLFTKQEASETSGDTHVSINSVAKKYGRTMSPDVPLSSSHEICPEPHSDSKGKSSSIIIKGAQLGRTRSLVQRWEKRETLNNESPTASGSIDTIPETSTLSHTSIERACAMAELFVLRLMPEPTAVALLYGQHQQQTVYDNMGRESSHIGEEDIVQNIMHHPLANMDSLFLSHRNNEMKAMGLLRVPTQDAVIKLSSQDIVMIDVDLENGFRICTVLWRPEFEEVNRKVFEKCESLVEQCVFAVRVYVEDISDVILVGEYSNIPKVKSLVLELCKKDEAYMGMDPLEAVVCSAALEGAVASGVSNLLGSLDLLTIQATPQSLGIEADGHTCVPIIPRNMTMPARKGMWFTTTRDNQTEVLIVVYEGEGKKVDEIRILGYFKIIGIPSAPKGIP
ncbi:hypothetical protein GIB67_015103 [Kingdonia uniflora]|uniref:Uncharacterized protein n=1 Tax=Kingdonia uniflora TaxID=39325 RepID=A0A7J7LJ00_9MAGN|nr:hypothetical protein GIB67_015103 [Kingdonia uniflora]